MNWWNSAMMRIFAPKTLKVRKQMEEQASPGHVHDYRYTSPHSPFKRCSCGLETIEVDWLRNNKKE